MSEIKEIKNKKINDLIKSMGTDPSKFFPDFIKILDSTDNAYKELHKKNEKLKAENKHLKYDKDIIVKSEKMASINQFSMGVAHEINNPISFIISNLNTLLNYIKVLQKATIENNCLEKLKNLENIKIENLPFNENETDEIKYIFKDLPELVNESLDGANRIKHIVKDLMLFKKPREELTQYSNINELIKSCVSFTYRGLEHKVIIKQNYGNIPEIKCFPNKLKQVFLNLIINAADAIDTKGTIYIKTEYINKNIVINFSDTGHGIKSKYINKIFDPFFTTKEVGQGMGLGLSTAYSIIKLHNGEIEVESNHKEGKGTSFTITLPTGKHDLDSIHQKLMEV